MYDTFIERPLTQSQRRCMQLSWHCFCGISYMQEGVAEHINNNNSLSQKENESVAGGIYDL